MDVVRSFIDSGDVFSHIPLPQHVHETRVLYVRKNIVNFEVTLII